MSYTPHTKEDIQRMLKAVGAETVNDLFDEIPKHLQSNVRDTIADGVGDMEVHRIISDRAQQDAYKACYIGAGAYEHYIPAAIWDLVTRGEFMTAYTPYQAEVSQGTLQVIYEYQSMMTQLMAMEISNASLYDGGSGLAEAILMAVRSQKKNKTRSILVPANIHPHYLEATRTIVANQNIDLELVPFDATGCVDQAALKAKNGSDLRLWFAFP